MQTKVTKHLKIHMYLSLGSASLILDLFCSGHVIPLVADHMLDFRRQGVLSEMREMPGIKNPVCLTPKSPSEKGAGRGHRLLEEMHSL